MACYKQLLSGVESDVIRQMTLNRLTGKQASQAHTTCTVAMLAEV